MSILSPKAYSHLLTACLCLAALFACGPDPKSPEARKEAAERVADRMIAEYTEMIEKAHAPEHYEQRAQSYRRKGDFASLKKAISDYNEAIARLPKGNTQALGMYLNARARTYLELLEISKDDATKAMVLADMNAAVRADNSSILHLVRGRLLYEKLDEPYLAEADLLEAIRLAGFEPRSSAHDVKVYDELAKYYGHMKKLTKGTPDEARYDKLFTSAFEKMWAVQKAARERPEAYQRERARNAALELQAMARRDAARAEEREKAQAEYLEARKKLWANRTECRACQGRGFQSAGGGSEFKIDWIQGARGDVMRSTTTNRGPIVLTCPECFGRGYREND